MKIGIFGGSFNPIHSGHLIIAEYCRCLLKLDRILFIPTGNPPHKNVSDLLNAEQRLRMVQRAIEDNPKFMVSDIEVTKDGLCYTIDTVNTLMRDPQYKHCFFRLLIGADSLLELHTWKSPEELLNLLPCIVMKRPGSDLTQAASWLKDQYTVVETPLIQISASDIRRRIQKGESIKYLVPEIVRESIQKEKIYK